MIPVSLNAEKRVNEQNLREQEARDEIEDKNVNFLQIKKNTLRDLRRLIMENPRAASLLVLMAEKMNKQNALMISFKALQEITGLSRSTLSASISKLNEEHWIQIIKVGTANAYIINSKAFWQKGAKARYTSFSAQIIATESEQEENYIEKWDTVKMRNLPIFENKERILIEDEKLDPPDQIEIDLS